MDEYIGRLFLQRGILPSEVKEFDWIKIYSTKYLKNVFVAIEAGRGNLKNMPVFGKILKIFVVRECEVYFYCQDYDTLYLEESLNSYRITEISNCRLLYSEDLCDTKPLYVWKDYSGSNYDYICLKHLLL